MQIDSYFSKPRVLVVDDEKRIRDGCTKMLIQEGFETAIAETGSLGLELLEREHYDIILLDLMMPGLSGFDVLERVKTLHPDTVIIVITGYATIEHSIEAMKKGAFDFIPKPFSPQDLRIVISKALEHIRTLHDITHEKTRMRVLINYLADGVMATDGEKKIALANPVFLKLIGHAGGDVITQPAEEVIPDEKLRNMLDTALALSPEDETELLDELAWKRPGDTEETILLARCVPFKDRVGRNLGTITVLRDITAEKKADQIKNDFVAMVAHEFRSPMNSVLMQIKVMTDGLAGAVTEKQKEILGRASQRIKALVALASELLDLAKIESGLMTQEKEPINLAQFLTEQVEFHQEKAKEQKIELILEDLPPLPTLKANQRNLDEVLTNLITNAIKYSPDGGQVKVGAVQEGSYIRIQVSDQGLGIPKEDQERVFDRFYRVKNEKTRYITGTGLGLPIVKRIVESHDGMLRLTSDPGHGSTFSVYLPVFTAQSPVNGVLRGPGVSQPMAVDFRKYTYWIESAAAAPWQDRLEGAGLDVFAISKAPCIPLSPRYEVGLVSPAAFTDYIFCNQQLSYYQHSPQAGRSLIISSVDLGEFGLKLESVITLRPDFSPPRLAGPQDCRDLVADPKYMGIQPREWAELDTNEKSQKQRWQRMKQLTGLEPEELWPFHRANHANFIAPKLFVNENGLIVPYSIARTDRICSACLELFNIVGTAFRRKLVVPCPGAVMFSGLGQNLYYQVDSDPA